MNTEPMQKGVHVAKCAAASQKIQNFPPLDQETRTHVETACAAFHLLRKPQTMYNWASLENGPIRPVRLGGRNGRRIAWAVADIKRLLNGGAA